MKLLIAAAMEVEEKALLRDRSAVAEKVHGPLGIETRAFQTAKQEIWICRCGIGPVNAALALAFIAARHPLDGVLLLGVGGALAPELKMGDVVLADKVVQHDSFASGKNRRELIAPGELYLSAKQKIDPVMPTDSRLTDWIAAAFPPAELRRGAILSGSEFVGNSERKLALAAAHQNALLVDMEAAGIAQVARRLGLPFAVAKTVADGVHPSDSIARDYQRTLSAAAEHAGQVLDRLLLLP